ncbi:MAG: hypothetical protein ABH877_03380 [bacterium]
MTSMFSFGSMYDPFARVSEAMTREFVRLVGGLLADRFRVEIKWDVTDYGLRPPNGELMVGVPDTEWRAYRVVKLPTWAAPAQIAGMIDAELRLKHQAWAESVCPAPFNPKLTVGGDVGLYEVEEFSVPKLL